MSKCDGCGEPIGHATGIEGEYEQFDDREKRYKYFGSSECKHIYEDAHDLTEKIECDECGELVEKSEAVEQEAVLSNIPVVERVHPECKSEDSSTTSTEGEEQ